MRVPIAFGLRPGAVLHIYVWRLRRHPGEEALATAGIAISVALVFGVLVASSSLTRSAGQIVHGVTGTASLQIAARSTAGFSEAIEQTVAQLPGVRRVGGVLRENATVVGPRGPAQIQLVAATLSVSAFGGSIARALSSGPVPETGGILLSSTVTNQIGARRGSSVMLLAAGAAHWIRVAEVLGGRFGASLAASSIAIAQLPVAQQLTGRRQRLTQILVEPAPNAQRLVLTELNRLAAGRLNVLSASQEVTQLLQANRPNQQSSTLFALIGAMVGLLLAASAVLLTLPDRRRDITQLRISGYGRAQICVIVLSQAVALGVLSSAIGVGLGYFVSHLMFDQVPSYLAFAFPISGRQAPSPTILALAFGGGLAASIVASLPILYELHHPLESALNNREDGGQQIPPSVTRGLGWTAVALACLVTVVALGDAGATLVCGVVIAVAVVCALPLVFGYVLTALTPISRRVKGLLALAVMELRATSTRSIALASVAALVVYGNVAIDGARHDVTNGLEATIAQYESTADVWVTTGNNVFDTDAFNAPNLASRLRALPTVAVVRRYDGGLLDDGDRRLLIRAHDPRTPVMLQSLAVVHGNLQRANQLLRTHGWATVSEGFAAEHHLVVGSIFALPTPSGDLTLHVAATTTNLGWPPGLITMSAADFHKAWLTNQPTAFEVNVKPGVDQSAGRREVQRVLSAYPGLQARTAGEGTKEAQRTMRQGLNDLGQIATLLLLIGGLSIAASLGAAIWQHRQKLAAMKIGGYDRAQLWRSLLLECTVLLGVGGLVGAAGGLYGHALASRYLRATTGFPAPFSFDLSAIVFVVFAVTAIALLAIALLGLAAASIAPSARFQE
jgi:putative ABC transport system permease protein